MKRHVGQGNTYLFDYELSIVSYYVKDKKHIGREANSRLLNQEETIPSYVRDMILLNAKHYL